MPAYSELLMKARQLRALLGEKEFRRRYGNRPSALMHDIGIRVSRPGNRGTEVLESFHFHELAPHNQALYEKVLESANELPLDSKSLRMRVGTSIGNRLRILEARGLVKLGKRAGQGGKLFVTNVLHKGRWVMGRSITARW